MVFLSTKLLPKWIIEIEFIVFEFLMSMEIHSIRFLFIEKRSSELFSLLFQTGMWDVSGKNYEFKHL
jgi:hypothetical protein